MLVTLNTIQIQLFLKYVCHIVQNIKDSNFKALPSVNLYSLLMPQWDKSKPIVSKPRKISRSSRALLWLGLGVENSPCRQTVCLRNPPAGAEARWLGFHSGTAHSTSTFQNRQQWHHDFLLDINWQSKSITSKNDCTVLAYNSPHWRSSSYLQSLRKRNTKPSACIPASSLLPHIFSCFPCNPNHLPYP